MQKLCLRQTERIPKQQEVTARFFFFFQKKDNKIRQAEVSYKNGFQKASQLIVHQEQLFSTQQDAIDAKTKML